MRIQSSLAVILLSFAVASCSVLTSQQYSESYQGEGGIPYFLPVGTLHLKVIETTLVTQAATAPTTPSPASDNSTEKPGQKFNPVSLPTAAATTRKIHALQLVETSYVPDPRLQFILNYKALLTSEDDVKVSIGSNGLLTKIAVSTEDKSGAIALKLVDLAKEVAQIGAIFGEGAQTVYEATFDPFDRNQSATVKRALAAYDCSYHLTRVSGSRSDVAGAPSRVSGPSPISGVAFRPVFAYNLTLAGDSEGTSTVQTVLLPNEAQVMTLPFRRAAFVKKVTTLNFDRGLLTEVDINKPSELLAFMDIPVAVAKAIVDIPGELVKLHIDTSKGNTDLANQQASQLQAEQALAQLRAQINKTPPQSPAPPPSTSTGAAAAAANNQH